MPVFYNGRVEHAGAVLRVERVTVNVSSDHAFLDSGNRIRVEYWDGRCAQAADYRTDDNDVRAEVDAAPELVERVRRFRILQRCWGVCMTNYAAAVEPVRVYRSQVVGFTSNVSRGDRVEVFKGRKAPNGTYTVLRSGEGSYGPYLDLRAEDGREVRYVNPENCRKPAVTEEAVRAIVVATLASYPGLEDFAVAALQQRGAAGWLVAADWLREQGRDEEADDLTTLACVRFNVPDRRQLVA